MKNFILIYFGIIFLFNSCNKNRDINNDQIKIYSGQGVVGEIEGGCSRIIKMYSGYENVLFIYSNADTPMLFKPSVISTENDSIHKRMLTENEILEGDSIYFEFREDYENSGTCGGLGSGFIPPNIFVTKIKIVQ
jgi:hypothetical protein